MTLNNLTPYAMITIDPEIIYILSGMILLFIGFLFGEQIVESIKIFFDYYFVQQKELISGKVMEIAEDYDVSVPFIYEDSNLPMPTFPPNLPSVHKVSIKKETGEIVLVRMREDKINELHIMISNSIKNLKCCKSKSEKVYSYDYT